MGFCHEAWTLEKTTGGSAPFGLMVQGIRSSYVEEGTRSESQALSCLHREGRNHQKCIFQIGKGMKWEMIQYSIAKPESWETHLHETEWRTFV